MSLVVVIGAMAMPQWAASDTQAHHDTCLKGVRQLAASVTHSTAIEDAVGAVAKTSGDDVIAATTYLYENWRVTRGALDSGIPVRIENHVGLQLAQWDPVGSQAGQWDHIGARVPQWDHVGTEIPQWDTVGTQGAQWDHIGARVPQWDHVGTEVPQWDHVGTDQPQWDRVGAAAPQWDRVSPNA